MRRRPPKSTLFPYTALFRPLTHAPPGQREPAMPSLGSGCEMRQRGALDDDTRSSRQPGTAALPRELLRVSLAPSPTAARSEEHTSELQSRQYLVCRLLLEKK